MLTLTFTLAFAYTYTCTLMQARQHESHIIRKCANPCWKSRVRNFKAYNKIIIRYIFCVVFRWCDMMNMTADGRTFDFNALPLNSDENVLSSRKNFDVKLLEAISFLFLLLLFRPRIDEETWIVSCLCVEKAIKWSDIVLAREKESERERVKDTEWKRDKKTGNRWR